MFACTRAADRKQQTIKASILFVRLKMMIGNSKNRWKGGFLSIIIFSPHKTIVSLAFA